jgi:hypothetical protein
MEASAAVERCDSGGFGLIYELSFQRWWHLGIVVTGTVQYWKRQREVAARGSA